MNAYQTILLAKMMVAVAWSDMDVNPLERKAVELLIGKNKEISHEDKLGIALYFEAPLSQSELISLLRRMQDSFLDDANIQNALMWIKKVIQADGKVDIKEKEIYDAVVKALKERSEKSRPKGISRFLNKNKTRLKPETVLFSVGREKHFEDYINNPLYFKVYQAMISGEDGFGEVPYDKNNLRRVCTAITLILSSYISRQSC
jgi:uncharacterized tellurite resistance protein B-like protein